MVYKSSKLFFGFLYLLFGTMVPINVKGGDFPNHIVERLTQVKPITADKIGLPERVLIKEGNLTLSENSKFWFLNSEEFNLTVEKETGLMCSLKSLNPTELYLLPPTKNGLVIYVWNKQYKDYLEPGWLDWFGLFNNLVESSVIKGTEEGKKHIQLNCLLKMDNKIYQDWADVKVYYTLFEERLDLRIEVNYKNTDISGFEIGIGHGYERTPWLRQLYPGESGNHLYAFPIDTDPESVKTYRDISWDCLSKVEDPIWLNFGPGQSAQVACKARLRYYDTLNDTTSAATGTKDCPLSILHFPMGIRAHN